MVSKKSEHETHFRDNLQGGEGMLILKNLLKVKPVNVTMFSEVTLPPNTSIGEHLHENESEIYYILEGQGLYSDNGKKIPVDSGDVTVCNSGNSHALFNNGTSNLKLLAIIVIE